MPTAAIQKRPTVLLCQPDHESAHSLGEYLRAKGFTVGCFTESDQAVDQIITRVPDVVLLDSRIPPAGGYDVCGEIRPYYGGPILFQGWNQDETADVDGDGVLNEEEATAALDANRPDGPPPREGMRSEAAGSTPAFPPGFERYLQAAALGMEQNRANNLFSMDSANGNGLAGGWFNSVNTWS